jgi:hypothetical protein
MIHFTITISYKTNTVCDCSNIALHYKNRLFTLAQFIIALAATGRDLFLNKLQTEENI